LIGIAGGFFRIRSFTALGKSFTFDVTKPQGLVTSGPYSVVRHPAYLGGCVLMYGLTAYHLSAGSWLRESGVFHNEQLWWSVVGLWVLTHVFICVSWVLRTPSEDKLMKKLFGEDWEAWKKIVRYRVFPGL
ncbi:hypothetical protein L218DRAFT_810833, partial [Marasmius fiardii PR-910]